MSNPYYPEGVTESDIDNIGVPVCSEPDTVIEYLLSNGDVIKLYQDNSRAFIGDKAKLFGEILGSLEFEFGEIERDETDTLVCCILDVFQQKYDRTETPL